MKELKFKTNINCNGCIAKVTPSLNQVKGIIKWEVDINDPEKILTVETDNLTELDVIKVLNNTGYKAELI